MGPSFSNNDFGDIVCSGQEYRSSIYQYFERQQRQYQSPPSIRSSELTDYLTSFKKELQLQRYMGEWFVLAHIPFMFKNKMTRNNSFVYIWNEIRKAVDICFKQVKDSSNGSSSCVSEMYLRAEVQN